MEPNKIVIDEEKSMRMCLVKSKKEHKRVSDFSKKHTDGLLISPHYWHFGQMMEEKCDEFFIEDRRNEIKAAAICERMESEKTVHMHYFSVGGEHRGSRTGPVFMALLINYYRETFSQFERLTLVPLEELWPMVDGQPQMLLKLGFTEAGTDEHRRKKYAFRLKK